MQKLFSWAVSLLQLFTIDSDVPRNKSTSILNLASLLIVLLFICYFVLRLIKSISNHRDV